MGRAMQYASLQWDHADAPRSVVFDDIYFAQSNGRKETEHVFMQGCHLPQDWQQRAQYTIAETGFGSGLNFLHCWQRFLATSLSSSRLTFISVDQYPLHPDDLVRVQARFDSELAPFAQQLQARYPLPVAGWHAIRFGRVNLLLGWGDASALYADFDAQVDAWFLDGFSPAKNPQLWTPALYQSIARLSKPGAKIASFTAAGHVRNGLEAVGFTLARRQGFAHKRHCISGSFSAADAVCSSFGTRAPSNIIIIGGGLSGCALAHALSGGDARVTLLEKAATSATGASGNPAAVLYPQLTQDKRPSAAFSHLGYAHTLRLLPQFPALRSGIDYGQTGMLKTPKDAKDAQRLLGCNTTLGYAQDVVRYINADEASEYLGHALKTGGAWYPHGCWINPAALCRAMLDEAEVSVEYQKKVIALQQEARGWLLRCDDGSHYEAECVILAAAQDCIDLYPHTHWKMRKTAGQISWIPTAQITKPLRAILCHHGYVIPQSEGHMIGATYDHDDFTLAVTEANHQRNKETLQKTLPAFLTQVDLSQWQGRSAIRATSFDRMPYLGKIAQGLYVSTAHGSRGLLSAPLGAEILAAEIEGRPLPLARHLRKALHCARL